LKGNGSGGFSAFGSPISTGPGPYGVVVGDFNRDGFQDLAIADEGSNPSAITVLLGNGSGGFSPGPAITAGSGEFSLVMGDFNGDGIQDLAAGDSGTGSVSVLLGDGAGGFSVGSGSPFSLPSASGTVSLAVGDFNLDGIEDIAAANLSTN